MTSSGIRHGECRCWSGKPAKECCRQPNGDWMPAKAVTKLSGPQTGFSHPDCYSSPDQNCSTGISREHMIPDSTFVRFPDLHVEGPRWLNGQRKRLPAKSQVATILCDRHNNNLSPLDNTFTELFATFVNFYDPTPSKRTARLFNGHNVERALLKHICNNIVAGWSDFKGKPYRGWKPDQTWLDFIWGRVDDLPRGCGLYVPDMATVLRTLPDSYPSIKFEYAINVIGLYGLEDNMVRGGIVGFYGFPLIIAMHPSTGTDPLFEGAVYRPNRLVLQMGSEQGKHWERTIAFAGPEFSGTAALPRVKRAFLEHHKPAKAP